MCSQHGIGGTYHEPLPPKVADYNVSGSITPNATCNYFEAGTYGGQPTYARIDGIWYLWRGALGRWRLSHNVGQYVGPVWTNLVAEQIEGTYAPSQETTGNAIVSSGPH